MGLEAALVGDQGNMTEDTKPEGGNGTEHEGREPLESGSEADEEADAKSLERARLSKQVHGPLQQESLGPSREVAIEDS